MKWWYENEEREMEFDKSRVYTALNADELRAGDKVIVAYNLYGLKERVKMFTESAIDVIDVIHDEDYFHRFMVKNGESYPLAYLVERRENCLKCKKCEVISDKSMHCDWVGTGPITSAMVEKCNHYEPKTEKKTYKYDVPIKGQFNEDGVIVERQVGECHVKVKPFTEEAEKVCENVMTKAEPTYKWVNYRPFRDTDELIKVWDAKIGTPNWGTDGDLTMPNIWVRNKENKRVWLITEFDNRLLDYLFTNCEFLDGSPCGVEE